LAWERARISVVLNNKSNSAVIEPAFEVNYTPSPEFENNNTIQPNSAKVCLLYLKALAALQTEKETERYLRKVAYTCEFAEKKNLCVISQQDMCSSADHISLTKNMQWFVEVRFKGLVLYTKWPTLLCIIKMTFFL